MRKSEKLRHILFTEISRNFALLTEICKDIRGVLGYEYKEVSCLNMLENALLCIDMRLF